MSLRRAVSVLSKREMNNHFGYIQDFVVKPELNKWWQTQFASSGRWQCLPLWDDYRNDTRKRSGGCRERAWWDPPPPVQWRHSQVRNERRRVCDEQACSCWARLRMDATGLREDTTSQPCLRGQAQSLSARNELLLHCLSPWGHQPYRIVH